MVLYIQAEIFSYKYLNYLFSFNGNVEESASQSTGWMTIWLNGYGYVHECANKSFFICNQKLSALNKPLTVIYMHLEIYANTQSPTHSFSLYTANS